MGGKGSKNKGDKGKNVQVVAGNSNGGGDKAVVRLSDFPARQSSSCRYELSFHMIP
jgi:hypothetical protein